MLLLTVALALRPSASTVFSIPLPLKAVYMHFDVIDGQLQCQISYRISLRAIRGKAYEQEVPTTAGHRPAISSLWSATLDSHVILVQATKSRRFDSMTHCARFYCTLSTSALSHPRHLLFFPSLRPLRFCPRSTCMTKLVRY